MWNQSIGLSEQETGPGGDFRLERNLFLSPACTQLAWTCTCTRVRSWPPSSFHANVELASQSARRLAHFHLDKVDIVTSHLSSRSQPRKMQNR